MTREEFIQQYVIVCATNHFQKDGINLAVEIADELDKVAPFNKDQTHEIKYTDKETEKMKVLETSLKYYLRHNKITSRTFYVLQNENINTIGDLIKWERADLLKLRNMGKKSLWDIDELLDELGLEYA